MPLRGYLDDEGKYVSASPDEVITIKADSAQFKAGDHERQRKDFAKEILQPYDQFGRPSEDYINAYPEIAKEKGMIPKGDEDGQS